MILLRLVLWILFLPLQLLLLALFSVCEGLLWLKFSSRPDDESDEPLNCRLCSIVMLNWNGRHLLRESLPALERALEATGRDHEVILVDNGSQDGSAAWVEQNHPRVRVLQLNENRGFGPGNNEGVRAATHDVVVLLNNDMVVDPDFLEPLLEGFSDPSVFAVSSQILFPPDKRREETGNTQAHLSKGYLHLSHQPLRECHLRREYLPVLWAGGGASAFHRRRFLELGGFSSIFSPCYLEDTDLSYRAWRRGWKTVLSASSRVLHRHRSSSQRRFDAGQLDRMLEQRKLWYLWKNFQLRTLLPHFLLFPLHLTSHLSPATYLASWRKLPQVLLSRLRQPARVVSDRTLEQWVRHPVSYLNHFFPQRGQSSAAPGRLRILIVSAYLPHLGRHGGAGRVFQLLRRVAARHEVTLVSFVETDEERREVRQLLPYCRRIETVFRRRFDPVSPFPYEPFEEFNSPALRKRLSQVVAEEDFDLVHFEWTQMAQYADLFPAIPKLVTEIEVNYAAHYSLFHVEPHLLRKVRKFYNTLQTLYREVELCGKVDRVICVTDRDRDYLKGYIDADKMVVVNTGVDTEYFTPESRVPTDPNALVYVGAFRHQPNVDAMLYFLESIWPEILLRRPRTHLYIVGSSPPPVIRSLQREPQITVTGFVPDIRDFYHKAQVVIVPLRTGVGIRGKILEGWAAGKAMVATSQACLGIRAVHGENIMIADEAEEFALWTLALLRHPNYCRRLGRRGRQTALQLYKWSRLGEQLCGLYEGLFAKEAQTEPGRMQFQ
ncbi:MAG: glycosyltransferase [Acidobacteriota bacterium]